MKIYVGYDNFKQYLQEHLPEDIQVVETKQEANWLVDGSFEAGDYHADLQGVIIPFTGHNGIDVAAMQKHDLVLFNTTVHAVYVAEMALRLTLGLLGNLPNYHANMKNCDWSDRVLGEQKRIPWVSLIDKKVGIYGYGRIGRHTKALLEPFTKQIYTIDRGKDYGDVTLVDDLKTLAKKTEILIVAAPLNPTTEGAIDATILTHMQDKYLINVGRGPIIEEKALYEALKNHVLAGFASDVWYTYPTKEKPATPPSNHPIHTFDNVVMTPHCGGHAVESKAKMEEDVFNRVLKVAAGDLTGALDLNKLK